MYGAVKSGRVHGSRGVERARRRKAQWKGEGVYFYKCHFRAISQARKCPDTPLSLHSMVYWPSGYNRITSTDQFLLLKLALCLAPSQP